MLFGGIVLAHLFGDYVFQSDWMANEKTKRFLPAFIHAVTYTFAYAILLIPVWHPWTYPVGVGWVFLVASLIYIGWTHYLIDRYRLVKQLIWLKNQMGPKSSRFSWREAKSNGGYSAKTPVWMSTWLMIITDNTIHLAINVGVILWFGGVLSSLHS
jgi:hypothetical protein